MSSGSIINSRDKHLNLFCFFGESHTLENNNTKAMINTFASFSVKNKIGFLRRICKVDVDYDPDFTLYLQSRPDVTTVKAIPEKRRRLIAFSPTGKPWGYNGIDVHDPEIIKSSIRESMKKNVVGLNEAQLEEKTNEEYQATKEYIENKGDSIPDAWIIIYKNGIPDYCIIFENKLYDLNPYQLYNHCKKSLFLEDNDIVYVKYEKIIDFFVEEGGFIADQFVRYLFILGYGKINNLSELDKFFDRSDEESIEKYASPRAKELLNEIGEKHNVQATYHKGWMWKLQSSNRYIKEIGLKYNSKTKEFEMYLYFCTNQSSARAFYSGCKEIELTRNLDECFQRSFHFQYVGLGKNVRDTHYSLNSSCAPEQYIRFWKENHDLIKQSDPDERIALLQKMKEHGLISEDNYKKGCMQTSSYGKKYNVVPEFGFKVSWTLEQAKELDKKDEFANEIKERAREIYELFGIKEELLR